MYILTLISVLILQITLTVSQPCEFKGSGQPVKIDDIQQAQNQNKCQRLLLSDMTISCDGSQLKINQNSLLTFIANDIQMLNVQMLCDNLEIQGNNIEINNSQFGIQYTEGCCSFLSTYVLYVKSTGNVILRGQLNHQKLKYGLLLFNSNSTLTVVDADVKAGNLAFHSINPLIIQNSNLTSMFIYCHDDYSTLKQRTKYTPEDLMQIKMSNQTEPYYEVTNLITVSKKNNKSEFNVLLSSLKYQYSLLIYSESSIDVKMKSVVSGSRVALFSQCATIEASTKIDSTGLGCPANYGLGKGLYLDTTQNCAANGASQATNGGVGLPISSDNKIPLDDINTCIFFLQQSSFVLQNIPYSYQNIYEGSGGAYKDQVKQFQFKGTEGAGGGLITIFSSTQAIIDGTLQSDGNSFKTVVGSGGSGGAINVKSKKIHGQGLISTKGGDSDTNGLSGEGAGGMVNLYQLDWTLDKGVNQFNGTIVTDKGKRSLQKYNLTEETQNQLVAKNGTYVSFVCPAGYEPQSNGYCKQCEKGYYKNGYVGKCRKCVKPSNFVKPVDDQKQFIELSDCYENCSQFNCDPLRFYVMNVISMKGIPYLLVYIFFICAGYISRRILRMKTKKIDSIPIQHVKYDYDDKSFANECKEKDIFFYRDLLYHKYRIQFYGENNFNSQWYLQLQIPEGTDQLFDQRDYAEFALKVNQILKWKKIDILILKFLNYIYFPIYWYYLLKVQKKMYKKIKDKIHDEPFPVNNQLKRNNINNQYQITNKQKFLKGSNVVHQEYIRMKIAKSDDYTLLYLDLFNYNKRNQKHFKKTMPTIIHFSNS